MPDDGSPDPVDADSAPAAHADAATPRLRRVVIINDSTRARGGATKLALQLARAVAAQGVAVTFFAGDDGARDEVGDGVDMAALGGARLLDDKRALIDGLYNRAAKDRLSALISSIDGPGVIYHVHGWAQILSPSIFDALGPVAARTFIHAHDFFLACPNGNYSIYPKSRQCSLTPMSARCLTTHCDKRNYAHKAWRVARQAVLNRKIDVDRAPYRILAIQEGMTPFLERGGVPASRITVVPNPAPRLTEQRIAAEANGEILYVGRLEHEKGVDLLAAAAARIGAPLRIIGAGREEEDLRRRFPDATFQGWASQADIAAAFRTARFVVMPTRCTEPFGLAAAEALRAGLPAMVSRSCLIGDQIERAGMGARCDIFDAEAFSGGLRDWLENDAKIAAMSKAAFRDAAQIALSPEDWVNAHINLYQDRLFAAQKVNAPGQ